jgi:hypothetical protein
MPTSSEDDKVPRKRAVRKRATRSSAESVTVSETRVRRPRKSTTKETKESGRKSSTRKKVEEVLEVSEEVEIQEESITEDKVSRKAPTSLGLKKIRISRRQRQQIIAVSMILVGMVASVAVGLTDGGQINVDATIQARSEQINTNTSEDNELITSTVEVPVQNSQKHAVGHLRGRGVGANNPSAPIEPTVAGTSTATSTDVNMDNASSTEAISIENEQGDQNVTEETGDATEDN